MGVSLFVWVLDEWGRVLHFYGGDVGDEVVLGIFCTLCGLLLFLPVKTKVLKRLEDVSMPLTGFSYFYRS